MEQLFFLPYTHILLVLAVVAAVGITHWTVSVLAQSTKVLSAPKTKLKVSTTTPDSTQPVKKLSPKRKRKNKKKKKSTSVVGEEEVSTPSAEQTKQVQPAHHKVTIFSETESTPDISEEEEYGLCPGGCGFFGHPSTEDLCSKCFKDRCNSTSEQPEAQQQQQETPMSQSSAVDHNNDSLKQAEEGTSNEPVQSQPKKVKTKFNPQLQRRFAEHLRLREANRARGFQRDFSTFQILPIAVNVPEGWREKTRSSFSQSFRQEPSNKAPSSLKADTPEFVPKCTLDPCTAEFVPNMDETASTQYFPVMVPQSALALMRSLGGVPYDGGIPYEQVFNMPVETAPIDETPTTEPSAEVPAEKLVVRAPAKTVVTVSAAEDDKPLGECEYGDMCIRLDCKFSHPQGRPLIQASPNTAPYRRRLPSPNTILRLLPPKSPSLHCTRLSCLSEHSSEAESKEVSPLSSLNVSPLVSPLQTTRTIRDRSLSNTLTDGGSLNATQQDLASRMMAFACANQVLLPSQKSQTIRVL